MVGLRQITTTEGSFSLQLNRYTKLYTINSAYALDHLVYRLNSAGIRFKVVRDYSNSAEAQIQIIHVQPACGTSNIYIDDTDLSKAKEILKDSKT